MNTRTLLLALSVTVLAACSGGGSGSTVPAALAPDGSAASTAALPAGAVQLPFAISLPPVASENRSRNPQYLGGGLGRPNLIVINLDSATNPFRSGVQTRVATTINAAQCPCLVYGPPVPVGSDTISVTAVDTTNASVALAYTSLNLTVTAGSNQTIAVALRGVPYQISLVDPNACGLCTPATNAFPGAFTLAVYDADGNEIDKLDPLTPFAYALNLTVASPWSFVVAGLAAPTYQITQPSDLTAAAAALVGPGGTGTPAGTRIAVSAAGFAATPPPYPVGGLATPAPAALNLSYANLPAPAVVPGGDQTWVTNTAGGSCTYTTHFCSVASNVVDLVAADPTGGQSPPVGARASFTVTDGGYFTTFAVDDSDCRAQGIAYVAAAANLTVQGALRRPASAFSVSGANVFAGSVIASANPLLHLGSAAFALCHVYVYDTALNRATQVPVYFSSVAFTVLPN